MAKIRKYLTEPELIYEIRILSYQGETTKTCTIPRWYCLVFTWLCFFLVLGILKGITCA